MEKVFVSSVMSGFAAERTAARAAIESLAFQPLMAELSPANSNASRQALLPLVDKADAVVLILGRRYGFETTTGKSPTHDEYDRAAARNIPVLVFSSRDREREPKQQAFVDHVGGGWEEGRFMAFYESPQDLLVEVVAGLNQLRAEGASRTNHPVAQARAHELSVGRTARWFSKMNRARVVFVPAGSETLIDALVLDDPQFADQVAGSLRASGIVSQAHALEVEQTSSGVTVRAGGSHDDRIELLFLKDGAVVVEASVGGTGSMGSLVLSYPRIQGLIADSASLAESLWALLPGSDGIRQIAAAVGVPEGGQQPLSLSGTAGGTLALMFNDEGQISVPDPPAIVDRKHVSSPETIRLLAVSLKQAFADRGGVRD